MKIQRKKCIKLLTTIVTMKMAETNVPTAIYKLCNPAVVPFETTALKLDSPNGRACVVVSESAFTTVSNINSSKHDEQKIRENSLDNFL